ncbi:hypothetical protein DPV78_010916 [Talaromyces pinophilus]|nr:hypothetical protein DPV78_010916 [Talaromyces pinophilus]
MPRNIFLIIYKSPLFPAHWSLWIPSVANPNIGKRIHVTGDVKSGFEHEFVRNYDLRSETRTHVVILMGEVEDKYVADDDEDLRREEWVEERDKSPRDQMEEVAIKIPAPGPSMNPASRDAAPTKRARMRNCQHWLADFVTELVRRNILPASADSAVQGAPKN